MKLGVHDQMAAHRKASVDDDDQVWDAGEIQGLAKLARAGDRFETDGVRFMVDEFNSKTAFEPDAQKQLFEVLVHEAKVDPKSLTGAPPEVVLAVQAGNSNKFYAMSVEGTDLVTRYGRIGTDGKTDTKPFESAAKARKQMMNTLRAKLKKGYAPVDPAEIGIDARPVVQDPPAAGFGLAEWHALSRDARDEMVEGYGDLPAGVTHTEMYMDKLVDPKQIAFAKAMRDEASDATGDFEIHDDEYLVVGDARFEVTLLTAANGDVLGGGIRAYQDGCEHPDDYWDDEEKYEDPALLREMADDQDVSWQAHGRYSAGKDGIETLYEPESMQWSGH